VFPGESLQVKTVLTNGSGQPEDVVDPASPEPPPLSFVLRSPKDGHTAYAISQAALFQALAGEDVLEPMDPEMVALQPGQTINYDLDLCEYAMGSFMPGDYHLVATYGRGSSAVSSSPQPVQVMTPKIGSLTSLVCPIRRLVCTAFDHLSDDEVMLFTREPFSEVPDNGVFERRLVFPQTKALQGLALAAHTAGRGEGRWLAWIQEDHVGAARPWGNALSSQAALTSPGLSNILLAEPGFQLPDGEGLFVVAGEAPEGAFVTRFNFGHQTTQQGDLTPLAPHLPGRLLACYTPDDQGDRMHLVWSEEQDATTRIFRRTYGGDGQPEDPQPVQLLKRDMPLAALELHPLPGGGKQAYAHALLGPSDEDGSMSYFRLPLQGPAWRSGEWTLPAPQDPVDQWAIASAFAGNLPVLALCGDTLLFNRAQTGGHWHPLLDGVARITHLHLLAGSAGQFWAGWCDPLTGLVYYPLIES